MHDRMEKLEKRIQTAVRSGLDRPEYLSPSIRFVRLSMDNVICGSPVPGGNEDIGYDEW
jgi:hypothetical protein